MHNSTNLSLVTIGVIHTGFDDRSKYGTVKSSVTHGFSDKSVVNVWETVFFNEHASVFKLTDARDKDQPSCQPLL